MRALIFSGGEFLSLPDSIDIKSYDIIIAADSGYLTASELGILPDVFVGDFDSCPKEFIKAKKIIALNPVKDMTDTQEAILEAVKSGAQKITLLGGLGNRIDHTISNIHLLKYTRSLGAELEIVDVNTYITLAGREKVVKKRNGFCLSLIPLTDCEGVSVSGVFYPLENASMPVGNPYGISNEFTEDTAHISLKSGDLLVVLCKS